jgi:hypothetical protein
MRGHRSSNTVVVKAVEGARAGKLLEELPELIFYLFNCDF